MCRWTSASDITARKQAEQALIGAEKLAVVGRLASSIAHEINNPLEAVTNLLYLAEQTADAETKQTLIAAQQELQRVSQIAANTLQFNRQKLLPAPMNVSKSVQSVLNLYEGRIRQAGIEVIFEKRDCPPLTALGDEIRQVLVNLVGNSVDAMKRGGILKIRLRSAFHPKTGALSVRITVADNGHGMSPTTQAQIYKPFFTTRENTGTGLGLWISANIIRRHLGTIRMKSSDGKGALRDNL
jgi:signal transduction histidine kinase